MPASPSPSRFIAPSGRPSPLLHPPQVLGLLPRWPLQQRRNCFRHVSRGAIEAFGSVPSMTAGLEGVGPGPGGVGGWPCGTQRPSLAVVESTLTALGLGYPEGGRGAVRGEWTLEGRQHCPPAGQRRQRHMNATHRLLWNPGAPPRQHCGLCVLRGTHHRYGT